MEGGRQGKDQCSVLKHANFMNDFIPGELVRRPQVSKIGLNGRVTYQTNALIGPQLVRFSLNLQFKLQYMNLTLTTASLMQDNLRNPAKQVPL